MLLEIPQYLKESIIVSFLIFSDLFHISSTHSAIKDLLILLLGLELIEKRIYFSNRAFL